MIALPGVDINVNSTRFHRCHIRSTGGAELPIPLPRRFPAIRGGAGLVLAVDWKQRA